MVYWALLHTRHCAKHFAFIFCTLHSNPYTHSTREAEEAQRSEISCPELSSYQGADCGFRDSSLTRESRHRPPGTVSGKHDPDDVVPVLVLIVALLVAVMDSKRGEGTNICGMPVSAWVRTMPDILSILFHFICPEAYSQYTDKVIGTWEVKRDPSRLQLSW